MIRLLAVLNLLVAVAAVGVLLHLASMSCPPPWAFWRFSDGGNFACLRVTP